MPVAGAEGEALTPMLRRLYNALVGLTPEKEPVVFRALWGKKNEQDEPQPPHRRMQIERRLGRTPAVGLQRFGMPEDGGTPSP